MKTITNTSYIVIEQADRGGGGGGAVATVAVMHWSDHIEEGIRQLSDSKFYTKTDNDLTQDHFEEIVNATTCSTQKKYITLVMSTSHTPW